MKFIHTSDLHIGKPLTGYSLKKDQQWFFQWLREKAQEIQPDAIVVAGDIFDRSTPSSEALSLFNAALRTDFGVPVLAISGNHDGAELLSLAESGKLSTPTQKTGWTLRTSIAKDVAAFEPIAIGNTDVWLLPWFTSADVRMLEGVEDRMNATEAMQRILSKIQTLFREGRRNLLVAHAMVGGVEHALAGSESIIVGTVESVSSDLFKGFDAVALGHIHKNQCCGNERIAYCGSPLAYSVDECDKSKFIRVTEIADDGAITSESIEVPTRRPLCRVRGTLDELTAPEFSRRYNGKFVDVVLTDEKTPMEPYPRLKNAYPLLMGFRHESSEARGISIARADFTRKIKENPLEVFKDFWEARGLPEPTTEQLGYVEDALKEINTGSSKEDDE